MDFLRQNFSKLAITAFFQLCTDSVDGLRANRIPTTRNSHQFVWMDIGIFAAGHYIRTELSQKKRSGVLGIEQFSQRSGVETQGNRAPRK